MAEQYWINDFFIDKTRNQITQSERSQTVPPKALAVLSYLAEHHGDVVSQDELLKHVWQDTIVSPNTLQRSIAQLRKALGDNGKGQTLIKTHAKQGYSLEANVRSHTRISEARSNNSTNQPDTQKSKHTSIVKPKGSLNTLLSRSALLAIFIFVGFLAYQHFIPANPPQLTLGTPITITATDDKEFDASYTPDGNYIVFHRYQDKFCVNKVWAKDVTTQQEFLLTKEWGAYGRHSFSEDGKKLIFFASQACDKPATQKQCYDLVSLDFKEALASPQQAETILQCRNSSARNPQWISDNNIVFMQMHDQRWKLSNYSIEDDRSSDFFKIEDGNLIDFSYSANGKLFAITSIHKDGQHYLEIIDTNGELQSSHRIKYPPEISKFQAISPSFSPNSEQLVFSTGKQLFTLSFDGKIEKINTSFTDRTFQPVFHPKGNRLLMLKGPYDSDLVLQSTSELKSSDDHKSFERSNMEERWGIFQPNGNLIAFYSRRSGDDQLWISGNGDTRQITNFPVDTKIRGMKWADDGKSLLLNVNSTLTQVYLNSALQDENSQVKKAVSFPLPHPILVLFQWNSTDNTALALARIEGIAVLVELDLASLEFTKLSDEPVLWAQKTSDGQLIYKDRLDQFWRPGAAEDQQIEILKNHGTKSKSFLLKDDVIYSISKENKLWQYDLNSNVFETLGDVGENVEYLSDIRGSEILLAIRVSAKKGIVEFPLND